MDPRRRLGVLVASTFLAGTAAILAAGPAAATGEQRDPAEQRAAQENRAAQQLAETYAPYVRLQEKDQECDKGEQFTPTDVDAVLDDLEVALRGPWSGSGILQVAPSADDVAGGPPTYYLDFPGDPLRPGCTYAEWSARVNAGHQPTVYAWVTGDPDFPGQLVVQYWFFYVFNDYNNTHEGDWESVQLIFDAATAEEALQVGPTSIGYSQHGGAERALWGDEKLEIEDDTHPVVYPAAGSHANHYEAKLYLGRGSEGLGCDDTTNPAEGFLPAVGFVPAPQSAADQAYPWLSFQGRWGERQASVFNGPTGPNMKSSWRHPIRSADETWRDSSTTVPGGALVGPSATGVFCSAVSTGSDILRETKERPTLAVAILLGLAGLIWFAAARTTWHPAEPLPAKARRAWGQSVTSAFQVVVERPTLFIVFGLVSLPITLAAGLLATWQSRDPNSADLASSTDSVLAPFLSTFALVLTGLTVLIYASMTAAVSWLLGEIDKGHEVTRRSGFRAVSGRGAAVAHVAAQYTFIIVLLTLFGFTIPLAIYYAVSRAYALPAVMLEGRTALDALRRSRQLVSGNWWRNAVGIVIVGGLGIAAGPIVGIVLLLVTDINAAWINVVSSLIYALALPLIALTITYFFLDRVVAHEEAADDDAEPRAAGVTG